MNAKFPTGPIKLAVVSSTNGGTSWTKTFVETSQQQPEATSTNGVNWSAPVAPGERWHHGRRGLPGDRFGPDSRRLPGGLDA